MELCGRIVSPLVLSAFAACTGAPKRVPPALDFPVKGEEMHPFYKYLTSKETAGKFAGEIRWNFEKFLIGRDGSIAARFEPAADPLSKEMTEAIEGELERAPERAEKEKGAEKP